MSTPFIEVSFIRSHIFFSFQVNIYQLSLRVAMETWVRHVIFPCSWASLTSHQANARRRANYTTVMVELNMQGYRWVQAQSMRGGVTTVYPKKYAHGFCFVVVIHWLIFPYPSGLLHWHCGNLTIAPVPAKQPWWIWINTSFEFIMNDYITTTKQSTTKPCAYFLGYTVSSAFSHWSSPSRDNRWGRWQLCVQLT